MSDEFANLAQFNFGEKLVELVLQKLVTEKRPIPHYSFSKDEIGEFTCDVFFNGYRFLSDRPLQVKRDSQIVRIDTESRIDVLAKHKNENECIAIEVKLGNSGGAEKFPYTFLYYWKNKINWLVESKISKDKKIHLKGCMIQMLDSDKFIKNSNTKIKRKESSCVFTSEFISKTQVKIQDKWWLVIRDSSLSESQRKQLPQDRKIKRCNSKDKKDVNYDSFKRLSKVFVFEDLWTLLKPEEKKGIINELTKDMKVEFNKLNSVCKKNKLLK